MVKLPDIFEKETVIGSYIISKFSPLEFLFVEKQKGIKLPRVGAVEL